MNMKIEARLAGIPAQIEVLKFEYVPESNKRWDCPDDAGGYDIEYKILDRKGYQAPWLEDKIDQDEIFDIIINEMGE